MRNWCVWGDLFPLKLQTFHTYFEPGFKTTFPAILTSKKKTEFKFSFDSEFAECLEMIAT